jgi:hypothetical protein
MVKILRVGSFRSAVAKAIAAVPVFPPPRITLTTNCLCLGSFEQIALANRFCPGDSSNPEKAMETAAGSVRFARSPFNISDGFSEGLLFIRG